MGFKGLKERVESFEYTSIMHYQNGNLQITSKHIEKRNNLMNKLQYFGFQNESYCTQVWISFKYYNQL